MPHPSIPTLKAPSVTKRAPWQDTHEIRINNWMTEWDFDSPLDVGFIGAPYSGASITPSSAFGGPEAVRMAFRFNVTFSPDWDTDIQTMTARDLGDIAGDLTNVDRAHQNIEDAISGVLALGHPFVPVIVGGDHSISAPAIRGFAKANPGKKIGVINFDAHMDVRNFDYGNHNGTPFRQILEREPNIDPKNFVEVGIHGFMNSSTYYKELLDLGTRVITGREVEKRGMEDCALEALELAGAGTDLIYVSVDIDCLAYPFTIGTSAASPEGLSAWQLLEAMWLCGQDPKVGALDVVEIDPSRDVKDLTARSGCSVILTFLAGLYRRTYGDRGY